MARRDRDRDGAGIEGRAHVVDRVADHHEAGALDVAAGGGAHPHDVRAIGVEVAEAASQRFEEGRQPGVRDLLHGVRAQVPGRDAEHRRRRVECPQEGGGAGQGGGGQRRKRGPQLDGIRALVAFPEPVGGAQVTTGDLVDQPAIGASEVIDQVEDTGDTGRAVDRAASDLAVAGDRQQGQVEVEEDGERAPLGGHG